MEKNKSLFYSISQLKLNSEISNISFRHMINYLWKIT